MVVVRYSLIEKFSGVGRYSVQCVQYVIEKFSGVECTVKTYIL